MHDALFRRHGAQRHHPPPRPRRGELYALYDGLPQRLPRQQDKSEGLPCAGRECEGASGAERHHLPARRALSADPEGAGSLVDVPVVETTDGMDDTMDG